MTTRQGQVIILFSTLIFLCSELHRVTRYTKGTQYYFHLLPCWIYLVSPFSLCAEVAHRPVAGHESQIGVTYASGINMPFDAKLLGQDFNNKIQNVLGRLSHCRDQAWGGF